jgi:glycerol kinase
LCKVTYGTGAFFLMNVGSKPKPSKHGLRTVAWRLNGRSTYAVEGAVFIAGAAVQWIRDGLKMISQSKEIETVAKEVPDSDGVFFVPALTGLGTPLWVPGARGLLGGLSRRSSRGHIARAVLEGIAHSVCDLIEALSVSSGTKPKGVRVDGGASLNDTLLAAQSRFLGIPLERPKDVETTARGAAMMAALGRGETTLEDLSKLESRYFRVEPRGRPTERKTLRTRWKKQLKACADLAVEADH